MAGFGMCFMSVLYVVFANSKSYVCLVIAMVLGIQKELKKKDEKIFFYRDIIM